MEGAPVDYAVNGTLEEQAAPQALQELQAAVQDVHAMPVVVAGFQEALAADPQLQAAAGTPADGGMSAEGTTPAMHLPTSGMTSGRGRMSSGSYKNRVGPLFCQVEGCGMPLDNLKEYHQRYKVCENHLKTPYIIRDGQQVRFCQQCGRFQPLEDFDDTKRSCRVRLQRHNARRRKRPRDGTGNSSAGDLGHYDMAGSAAAAAEMAKLAGYGAAAVPISPKELQSMQEALQFASTTLMHSSQVVTGKPAGEEGGEGGEGGAGVAMGPGSMPFVPAPDVMMLLLKGYAAMFHYALDSATLRALAPPSELPNQDAAAAGSLGLGAMDALQMQHLMNAQGFFGAAGMPLLLPTTEGGGLVQGEGGELGGGAEGGAEGGEGGEAVQQEQQQEHGGAELTAEQVAAALIQPMPQDAAAAEGAMAAAAALAAAAEGQPSAEGGYAADDSGAAAEAAPESDGLQQ